MAVQPKTNFEIERNDKYLQTIFYEEVLPFQTIINRLSWSNRGKCYYERRKIE